MLRWVCSTVEQMATFEVTDEVRYHLLKMLELNPSLTQREIAGELGLSLGKVNYCLKALAEKGWLKARNFKNNNNKLAYMYLLTPSGLKEKTRVTYLFLRQKLAEVEELRGELESLTDQARAEVISFRKSSAR